MDVVIPDAIHMLYIARMQCAGQWHLMGDMMIFIGAARKQLKRRLKPGIKGAKKMTFYDPISGRLYNTTTAADTSKILDCQGYISSADLLDDRTKDWLNAIYPSTPDHLSLPWNQKYIKENKNMISTSLFGVNRIIFNGPATIVFWDNGDKTVVKRNEKDPQNDYNAFCAALAKHLYGTNSALKSIIEKKGEHVK